MKISSSIRLICKNCRLVKRKKILRIICINSKHKQKQG